MAPTITTQLHTLFPNVEVSFGTITNIAGFDFIDAFVDGSQNPDVVAEWRLYEKVGGLSTLVATAPGGGAQASVLAWQVGGSGIPARTPGVAPFSPAEGSGFTFELRAFLAEPVLTSGPPPNFTASLIGYDEFDVAANSDIGSTVVIPPNFSEITIGIALGYAQFADCVVSQSFNVPIQFTLYARAGVGGVIAEVARTTLRSSDGNARIFGSPVRLPGATDYQLRAKFDSNLLQTAPPGPVAVSGGLATHSQSVAVGGVVNLTGNVNGPSNANRWTSLLIPMHNASVVIPEVGPVPGDGWWFVGIQSLAGPAQVLLPLNPTGGEVVVVTDENGLLATPVNVNGNGHLVEGVPVFALNVAYPGLHGSVCFQFDVDIVTGVGAWYIFADYAPNAIPPVILAGDAFGPAAATTVGAWRNRPLDPVTMAAPNPGDVPEWDGAKWIATPGSGAVALDGDVQGPAGNNVIVRGIGSIIYRPGVPSATDHVGTWAEVAAHIISWNGKCIIYIDDSLVSPALVPGATGITDCFGRVELRPYVEDGLVDTVLQIESGATLRDLFAVNSMELRCNPQNATPSLDFVLAPNGGFLFLLEESIISNAATATQPAIVVPAAKDFGILGRDLSSLQLGAPAVPLVNISALTSNFSLTILTGGVVPDAFANGPGNCTLSYDDVTATFFPTPGVPPVCPGITGAYITTNIEFETPPTKALGTIIYKPGTPSAGDHVATWPEVASFILATDGKCIVYVDDSIVSPALVPGATGVTQCFGRVEIRPSITDSIAFSVLQVENGATLKDLWKLTGMELRCNSTGATPSLDWSATPNGGAFYLEGFSQLSNAVTATNPGIRVLAGRSIFLSCLFSQISLNAPAIPLINIALGGTVAMLAFDCAWVANVFSGAGNVNVGYDMPTAQGFAIPGVPPPQPALAGTYNRTNVDDLTISQQFLLSATNIFAGGPNFGTRLVKFTGCGGGGAGGGGSGGTVLGATGNGGGAGGASLFQNFDVFIDFTHRIDIIIAPSPTAGAAGAVGVDGTPGGDGGTCYVLDFTANVVLCAFAGGSGGAQGTVLSGPGLGGANFPTGQRAGNLTTGSQGFLAAGGNGGSQTGPITPGPGNFNISTFGLTPPGPAPNLYLGGAAGLNGAVGQGGGGGGGGQGPFGPGGAGGSGNAGTGTQGTDVNVGNPGSGAGGGAGGAAANGGARGGIGSLGQITYSYRP